MVENTNQMRKVFESVNHHGLFRESLLTVAISSNNVEAVMEFIEQSILGGWSQ